MHKPVVIFLIVESFGQPKIGHFCHSVAIDEDIPGCQIPMNEVPIFQIFHAAANVTRKLEKMTVLCDVVLGLHDVVPQIASLHELCDDPHGLFVGHNALNSRGRDEEGKWAIIRLKNFRIGICTCSVAIH